MKRFLLLLISFFYCATLLAQQVTIESLKKELSSTTDDMKRVDLMNKIADSYKGNNPKLTMQYATEALQLAKEIQYPCAEANAQLNMANANIITGNYPLALQQLISAQTILEALEESSDLTQAQEIKNGLARVYGGLGVIFSEQSNYAKAIIFHFKALKIYELTQQFQKQATVYNNIGVEYEAQGECLKALSYYSKGLAIQKKRKDPAVGITVSNIGNVYLKMKNNAKAFYFFNQAQQLFQKYPNQRGLGDLYNSFGAYYHQLKTPQKAIQYYALAINLFSAIEDKFGVAVSYSHLAELYFEQKEYKEAMKNATASLQLAQQLDILELIASNEQMISQLFEKQNDSKLAFQHYKLYSEANNNLKNEENIRNSVRAEMTFEFDKKEMIQRKEAERKALLYSEHIKRNNLTILFVLIFSILLAGMGFLIYNRIQLKKTLTLQKELAEYEQKALHLQMNPHFVFNCLGSISSFIVQNGTDSAIKYLAKFSKLMRLTLEYSKESLIPIDKEIESLQNYLELEQLRFNKKFIFEITKSEEIEDDMALPSLLLQPFVENSIIHGLIPKKELGNIKVHFAIQNQSLVCSIIDNGIGYKTSRAMKAHSVVIHKSMALDITKKRLEMMEAFTAKKAQVSIDEIVDANQMVQGTKVVLHLPIQYVSQ
jgi:tetratricopeptide (TPR) repeat protein